MITLENDRLVFRFAELHEDAVCSVEMQRTLRLSDDGRDHPLPPGLGRFPLRHLDDLAARVPEAWRRRGGVVAPMYQSEAMWLRFETRGSDGWRAKGYPFAIKIGTGKINALTGEPWVDRLNRDPQDYLVVPEQPWLDGYCVEKGVIRQFVAMPLGRGYTAEEQLTRAAEWGGLQIVAYPMKPEAYRRESLMAREVQACIALPDAMGLAPGGRMRQEVYTDSYDLADWDQRRGSRCFVTIVDALGWLALTHEAPPGRPPSAKDYAAAGLPWFEWYDADAKALEGAARLMGLESVATRAREFGDPAPLDDGPIDPATVIGLGPSRPPRVVRESRW